jgi:endogenous inhibitor of DNA gyrase (YacG/DUF329 family)
MFCPKCGQQQISDTTRFCSRCGLPIDGLADWLAGGAFLARRDEPLGPKPISHKRKGIRRGGKILFLSFALLPLFLGMAISENAGEPLIVPFTIFAIGLATLLYYVIFGEDSVPAKKERKLPSAIRSAFSNPPLPPAQPSWPTTPHNERVRTAELVQPPSVTENTTRLLDDDQ